MTARFPKFLFLICPLLASLPSHAQSVKSAGAKTDDARAEKAFADGQAAAKAKLWDQALEQLTTAILYKNDYLDANRSRARVYTDLGRDAEALSDWNTVLKAKPDDGDALAQRGLLHLKADRAKLGQTDIEKAIAAGVKTPAILNARARSLASANEHEAAIAAFTESIRLQPADEQAFMYRGASYLALPRFQEALSDFTRCLELRPGWMEMHIERGFALGQLGNYDQAAQEMTKALALEPRQPRALFLRGEAYRRLNRFPDSIADFTAAISVTPEDANLRLARASTYTAMNQIADAFADRTEAIRLQPDNPRAYVARGGSLHMLDRHEEGYADRSKAIQLAPDLVEAWLARGSAYYLNGNYQMAVPDLERARQLAPRNPEVLGVLAAARKKITEQRSPAPPSIVPVTIAVGPPAVSAPAIPPARGAKPAALAPGSTSAINVATADTATATAPGPTPGKKPDPMTTAAARTPSSKPAPAAASPAAGEATPAALQEQARRLSAANDFKGAIAAFTAALEKNPKLALAWNGRGYARLRSADYNGAVEDFTAAIRVNPNYANAYRNRAAAFKALGNAAMAAEDADMANALSAPR